MYNLSVSTLCMIFVIIIIGQVIHSEWLERCTGNPEVAGSNSTVLLVRKGVANHLINGSGLDKKWQLSILFLKPAFRQYTNLSFFCKSIN